MLITTADALRMSQGCTRCGHPYLRPNYKLIFEFNVEEPILELIVMCVQCGTRGLEKIEDKTPWSTKIEVLWSVMPGFLILTYS